MSILYRVLLFLFAFWYQESQVNGLNLNKLQRKLQKSHYSKYAPQEPFELSTNSRKLLRSRSSSGKSSSSKYKSSSSSSSYKYSRFSSSSKGSSDCSCKYWQCGDYTSQIESTVVAGNNSNTNTSVNDISTTDFLDPNATSIDLQNGGYNTTSNSSNNGELTEYEQFQACVLSNSDIWESESSCVYCGECNSDNGKCVCKSFMWCQWGWIVGFTLAFVCALALCVWVSYHVFGMDYGWQDEKVMYPCGACCFVLILGIIFVICFEESYKW